MKDFDSWNDIKKLTDGHTLNLFFKEQEVWWARCGLNIGVESNGKGQEFARPVLILKKHNQHSCLVVSLTTRKKLNRANIQIDSIEYPDIYVNLSQIRVIDSKRLVSKMFFLNKISFQKVKESIRTFNCL